VDKDTQSNSTSSSSNNNSNDTSIISTNTPIKSKASSSVKKSQRSTFSALDNNKYNEKTMLLGSKEEYEKFFKNDKTCIEFTEKEKSLLNFIDFPRRKKKGLENKEADVFDFFAMGKEKSIKLKNELKGYKPLFEKELDGVKQDKKHAFMIKYFPNMYQIKNFYLYIKRSKDRKDNFNEANLCVEGLEEKNTQR